MHPATSTLWLSLSSPRSFCPTHCKARSQSNTGRIVASTKLNRFIKDEVTSIWPGEPLPLKNGDAVKLFIAQRTELGYKAVVNNEYWGKSDIN